MEPTHPRVLALPFAAIVLIVIGSIGPWVSVSGGILSKNGLEGDGVITLVLALVAAGVLLLARARKRQANRIVLGICALLALAISIFDINDVMSTDFGPLDASVGWGLWVTAVGSLALVVAVIAVSRRREPGLAQAHSGQPPS